MFLTAIVCLLILGWGLQTENAMKFNTLLKVIDILLMILIVSYFISKGSYFYILAIIFAVKLLYNTSPFFLLWGTAFENTMLQFQTMYVIDRVKPLFDKRGGVFIANHASGCFNDYIASCALGSESRLLVVNPGPLGASGIPRDSTKYICPLDRSNGRSGYEAMKSLIRTHVMKDDKSLIVFGEDLSKKTSKWLMAPVRSGILKLCWEMNIPLYGMWIDWPCQFPITFRDDDRRLEVREWIIHESPGDFDTIDELSTYVNNVFEKYINCSGGQ